MTGNVLLITSSGRKRRSRRSCESVGPGLGGGPVSSSSSSSSRWSTVGRFGPTIGLQLCPASWGRSRKRQPGGGRRQAAARWRAGTSSFRLFGCGWSSPAHVNDDSILSVDTFQEKSSGAMLGKGSAKQLKPYVKPSSNIERD